MTEYVELDGKKYYLQHNGYYKGRAGWLHIVVWERANGKVPEGCEIHHRDFNPANNALENLQCLTLSEHKKIHVASRPVHIHVCEVCGKEYEARNYTKKNRFCSPTCHIAFLRKQGYYDETRICQFCGKEFVTRKYSTAKFCSNSCAHKVKQSAHRANGQFVKKDECASSCLIEEQKALIRDIYKSRNREFGATALARKFGVHRQTISKIVHEG